MKGHKFEGSILFWEIIQSSPKLNGYKILMKMSKWYINFKFNQNGKIAGRAAILFNEKSKIAVTPAIY